MPLYPGSVGQSAVSYLPISFSHWHDESTVITGNPLTSENYSNYPYAVIVYQNPGALNDVFQFKQLLDAGTYDIYFLGVRGITRGIIRLSVNNSNATNDLDFYGNAFSGDTLHTTINIPVAGIQTLKVTTVDKNASSSGYLNVLTKIWGIKQ